MSQLLNIASVSDLRNKSREVIERTKNGPLFILLKNKLVVVMVHPDEFNEMKRKIKEAEQQESK